jgi:hypothetical protein
VSATCDPRFQAACDLSSWNTYDCQAFVAKANGCPDPALIYPNPDGEITCVGRSGQTDSVDQARADECERRKEIEFIDVEGHYSASPRNSS